MINKNEIKLIVKSYDKESNMIVAMEECAELIQAISKMRRKPENKVIRDNLIEEISDVIICIEILKENLEIKDSEIDSKVSVKMKRNIERIDN